MAAFPLKPVSLDPSNPQSRELFQIAFDRFLTATKQKTESAEVKAALLYGHAGEELQRAIVKWDFEDAVLNDYQRLKEAITDKLKPDLNPSYASLLFNLATREPEETLDAYVQRLKELVVPCKYTDTAEEPIEDRMVKDRIIVSLGDANWQFALVKQKKLTLKTLIEELKLNENSLRQVKHMQKMQNGFPKSNGGHAVDNVTARNHEKYMRRQPHRDKYRSSSSESDSSRSGSPGPRRRRNSPYVRGRQRSPQKSDSEEFSHPQCNRCGTDHKDRRCPASGKTCITCHKIGHFSKMCFSRKTRD